MFFRVIHWVLEVVDGSGKSKVFGVYTSIQDLIEKGLNLAGPEVENNQVRLTLVKLDSAEPPLGQWFDSIEVLEDELKPFIESGELEIETVNTLIEAFRKRGKVTH